MTKYIFLINDYIAAWNFTYFPQPHKWTYFLLTTPPGERVVQQNGRSFSLDKHVVEIFGTLYPKVNIHPTFLTYNG